VSLTPPVSASGIFALATPFEALLIPGVSYTCIAVRKFADIQKLGIDPYSLYYLPNGLTEADYTRDAQAGECIVTLRSNGGSFLYVPTSYILSYPNMGGIPYTAIVLGISLGAIPNYVDLSAVKTKIANIVQDTFGIIPQIQQAAISETKNMSITDANAIESARQAAITDSQTDLAKYLAAQAQLDAALDKITELENYIASQIPPVPATLGEAFVDVFNGFDEGP
jgi:hypothetical protein